MNQVRAIYEYKIYLKLEKGLSDNSVYAYLSDINKFMQFLSSGKAKNDVSLVKTEDIRHFLQWISELGMTVRSQARILSSLKSFFSFLLFIKAIETNPAILVESPRIGVKLPVVLSTQEVDALKNAIDLSTQEGHRNRAIIEVLYSCGLRVSE